VAAQADSGVAVPSALVTDKGWRERVRSKENHKYFCTNSRKNNLKENCSKLMHANHKEKQILPISQITSE
jgi:hypothetical protein